MYNDDVLKTLNETKTWYLGTFGEEANVVPMGMKTVLPDGTLAIGNNFMNVTLKNIEATGKATVCVYNPELNQSYQIKGSACHVTEGEVVDNFKALAEQIFKGAIQCKGAVLIKPDKIIVATPGPDNNKVMEF